MENKSTVEQLADHFKKMATATAEEHEVLRRDIETLLNQSRERLHNKVTYILKLK